MLSSDAIGVFNFKLGQEHLPPAKAVAGKQSLHQKADGVGEHAGAVYLLALTLSEPNPIWLYR